MTAEWPSPGGPKSRPYGITIVDGIVWYSEAGVRPNTLVRFDPKTEKFQTWVIPAGGGVVRNMMHTTDGKLVLTESGENVVALVTIKNSDKMAMGFKVRPSNRYLGTDIPPIRGIIKLWESESFTYRTRLR
jgi:streptogramin lyase